MKIITSKRIRKILDREVKYHDVLNDRTDTLDRIEDIEDIDENLLKSKIVCLLCDSLHGSESLAEELTDRILALIKDLLE